MNDERIIAYLLEELPPEESARFEEECFDAETWPAEIALAEDELVEDYLRGGLSPERRERFRLKYLTTGARRERFAVAAALLRHADEAEVSEEEEERSEEPAAVPTPLPSLLDGLRGFWGGHVWAARAVAALLAVAVAAGVWWVTRTGEPRHVLALTLAASRGERAQGARAESVALPRGGDALRISLLLPEGAQPAERYRVELEDERGAVTALEPSAQDARQVTVVVRAAQLARGAYALKLYALEGGQPRRLPGNYFLNVE